MSYEHTVVLPDSGAGIDVTRGSLLFIGTATVLLRYAGFTILTDPNFLHRGEFVYLGFGMKSERVMEPAMELKDLPPIDIVVLSHLHEDHFDRFVANHLAKSTPIVTTPKAAQALRKMQFTKVYALSTWAALTLKKNAQQVHITSLPGRHGPGIVAKALPPVMGSMLEFGAEGQNATLRLYISGDTLVYKDLQEIPKRYPDIDLGLLHLGGTTLLGIVVTMDAKQGVEAMKLIHPRKVVPIHFNDYTVFKSPLGDFRQAVANAKLEDRVHYLRHGETYTFEVPIGEK
jgi:L-ascorbate metabolism protein UlaG (beta-lactamase superfamily)